MKPKLFVYGSLAPGESNAHMLSELQGSWQKATTNGELVASGWGNAMGFPGIRLSPTGNEVPGLVFESADLTNYWHVLDAFEGKEYQRVITQVVLESGSVTEAFVYELLPEQT